MSVFLLKEEALIYSIWHHTHNDAKLGAVSEGSHGILEDFLSRLWQQDCGKANEEALLFFPQEGEVDCWPLTCPSLSCEYTTNQWECCPQLCQ